MFSKSKIANIWQSLSARNLSQHSDENFKLAQFLKTTDNNILFDIRETFRGRKTENGFSLPLCEYHWMTEVLRSNDDSAHILEHNNRVLTIDKSLGDILIKVSKADSKYKKILLRKPELSNLLGFFSDNEENIKKWTSNNNISVSFPEKSFYRITIK